MQARFAYLVMAHQKPRHLEMLLEAIYDPRDLFLVHVDLKSTLGARLKPERAGVRRAALRFAEGRPNVRLLRPRFTNWGGWSLSRLHLDAIDAALDASPDWTHFVNLSGQCYPIKPMEEVRGAVGASDGAVFAEMRHFSSLPADDWHLRWLPMLEIPPKAIVLKGRREPPGDFELEHKGSQWSILPRGFCEWQRGAAVSRTIRRYLSRLLLSDELIVQALVRNGPWRDSLAPHYGREILMPGPKVMTSEDLPMLFASPGFFSRKFDEDRDPHAIPAIAERMGLRLPEAARAPAGA